MIVVFAVQNLSGQSAQASCGSDYKTVETAVEGFNAQIGVYPNSTGTPGWTVVGTAPTPPAEITTDGANAAGTVQLMTQYTNGTTKVGPWLKDWPVNAGHYSVGVDQPATATGDGTVTVFDSTGAAQAAGAVGCQTV